MSRSWHFTVDFDPIEVQVDRDPENAFPNDEASKFVGFIMSYWGVLPEELDEGDPVLWINEQRVILKPEVLDQIAEPMQWLLFHSIPTSITLVR